MYGGRGSRPVEARAESSLHHYSVMHRKPIYSGGNDYNTRGSRGKGMADEETRLGSSRGGDRRVANFSGGVGRSRGSGEYANRHHLDDLSPYMTMAERRDDSKLWKLGPGAEEAVVRAESGGRFQDGISSRGERAIRPAPYSDGAKLVRIGNYDDPVNESRARSLRDVDHRAVTKNVSSRAILPGFILECSRRSILESFSSPKGDLDLPIDERRLDEQVGPSTKIFMFDRVNKQLFGVFQAESYTHRVPQGLHFKVRVRVVKECAPLTERQIKNIFHESYYDPINFPDHLSKDQVMKLLQAFREVDAPRGVHVSVPTSRRISDSGLSQSSQELHSLSDEIVYRKEERWRRGTVESRSLSDHSYHPQEETRFASKSAAERLFTNFFGDIEDEEGIENLPVSTSRLTAGPSPYSTSRGKQQSLRTLSGSRDLGLPESNWRADTDSRDASYKKRVLSPSPTDEFKRGCLDASFPSWKDHQISQGIRAIYDRPGKGVYKGESSYLSSRRRRHGDFDLNIPLEMGQGELAHAHDVKSKGVRRKVWVNDEEEEKGYSVSPPISSLIRGSTSMHMPEHLLSPEPALEYNDDSRLDSRHMVNANGRPVLNTVSNGKYGSPQSRTVTMKSSFKDKPLLSPFRKLVPGRDSYNKESTLRGAKAALFKIKANLQTPERGRPERVVTMTNERVVTMENYRFAGNERLVNGGASSQGRKRKASVWSRISLPGKVSGQKGPGPQGRGRVFSRLGPSVNATFERRDDVSGQKIKKARTQQPENEADLERFDEDIENSPDALQGEDYLNEDDHAGEGDKEMESASDGIHSWTRKKASVVNSGDESGNLDHQDWSASSKGGRRKLVRPSIGTPTLDEAEGTHAHVRSLLGSLSANMSKMEAQAGRGSLHDLNSVAEEEDFVTSS